MKYTIMVYETETSFSHRTNDQQEAYWGAYRAYSQALAEAGVSAGGAALHPPRLEQQFGCMTDNARYRMVRLPIPKSNWAASLSSTFPTWIPLLTGQPVAQLPAIAVWKCALYCPCRHRRIGMKLYYFPPSPNTRKVHAVAIHLELPLDLRLVDLQKGEQRSPEFLSLNPTGRTPILQDGDFILWESTAIMQYLASQTPNSLFPDDPKSRADILRWQSWQLAHWHRGCQPLQYENFVKPLLQLGDPDPQVVQQATEIFHQEAIALNTHLAERQFLVNDTLTLADFSVASDLTYAVPGRFPLDDYLYIRTWYAQIEQLPAWQQTIPRS